MPPPDCAEHLRTVDGIDPVFVGIDDVNSSDCCLMKACLHNWKKELADDFAAEYLLNGIENGFALTDCTVDDVFVLSKNYASASVTNKLKV